MYVYECYAKFMYASIPVLCNAPQKRALYSLELELPYGCWDLNLGPL